MSVKTRTSSTEQFYRETAARLFETFERKHGKRPSEANIEEIEAWIRGNYLEPDRLGGQMSKAGWRVYRAALAFTASERGMPHVAVAVKAISGGSRTSINQPRLKRVSEQQWDLLLKAMKAHPNLSATLTLFLRCGRLCGLRPSEWQGAELTTVDNEPALVVKNGKSTNGRSHGPTRTLLLGQLSKAQIEMLDMHIRNVRTACAQSGWPAFYLAVRNAFRSCVKPYWPNPKDRPTLYIARHLFSADAKAAGRTKQDIAAMMGHASDDTATMHYAKKRYGTARRHLVRPYAPDILRVNSRSRPWLRKFVTPNSGDERAV